MKSICLGEIVAAHGIKGHVKIKTFTEKPTDIARYGALQASNGTTIELGSVRASSPFLVVATVKGINDRNTAETLRGIQLFIDRAQLPPTNSDEYYHEDLVGMRVVDESKTDYGVITGLHDFGAGVFFDIESDESTKTSTLPFTKEAVLSVDTETRVITIDSAFLLV